MLIKNEKQILRVLMQRDEKSLVIDCIKRTMPKWVLADSLASYEGCSDAELCERTAMPLDRQLSEEEKRIAQERFNLIAGVLPYIGDEDKRSKYRLGSSFEAWMNSELNTDGWYFDNNTLNYISADGKYSINSDFCPTIYAQPYSGLAPGKSTTKALYCFNSQTELYLTGIQVLSEQFPEENVDGILLNNIRNYLGLTDNITINMDVYYDGIVENMKVYFAPHSGNTTDLPADATEVPVSETTVTRQHPYGDEEVLAATVNYKPAEDPNFSPNFDVDMFIAYKDEIIYKVVFPQFTR